MPARAPGPVGAPRGDQSDRLLAQAPESKLESRCGRRVEPLGVVDRTSTRFCAASARARSAAPPRPARRSTRAPSSISSAASSARRCGGGSSPSTSCSTGPSRVGEAREGKPSIRSRRPGAKDANPAGLGLLDRGEPDRRLADPGSPSTTIGAGSPSASGSRIWRQLVFSADDVGGRDGHCPRWRWYEAGRGRLACAGPVETGPPAEARSRLTIEAGTP
jgi:hypothetical protein